MGRKELFVAGRVALFLVFAVVLQTVLISHLRILGVTADLFLILTIVVAVSRGSLQASVFGFVAGLIAVASFSGAVVRKSSSAPVFGSVILWCSGGSTSRG